MGARSNLVVFRSDGFRFGVGLDWRGCLARLFAPNTRERRAEYAGSWRMAHWFSSCDDPRRVCVGACARTQGFSPCPPKTRHLLLFEHELPHRLHRHRRRRLSRVREHGGGNVLLRESPMQLRLHGYQRQYLPRVREHGAGIGC